MSSATNFNSANLDHVRQHVDQVKYHVVPTLADIGQLVWDDFDDDDIPLNRQNLYEEEEEEEEEDDDDDEGEKENLENDEESKKKLTVGYCRYVILLFNIILNFQPYFYISYLLLFIIK